MVTLAKTLRDVRSCSLCKEQLAHSPRPVVQMHSKAKILIAGQAPGRKVHESGIPFDDASGTRLREWLGITESVFYDPKKIAILPMGFCYPGSGKSGDFAPRPECAPQWRAQLLAHLQTLQMTLVIGQYAQRYHLPAYKGSVTDVVSDWKIIWPDVVPLPHPSPRNIRWFKTNPWFETDLVPALQAQVKQLLS